MIKLIKIIIVNMMVKAVMATLGAAVAIALRTYNLFAGVKSTGKHRHN